MKRTAAVVAALMLGPMVLLAQKTSFDYDKTANFGAYKTYALVDGKKVGTRSSTSGSRPRSKRNWPRKG